MWFLMLLRNWSWETGLPGGRDKLAAWENNWKTETLIESTTQIQQNQTPVSVSVHMVILPWTKKELFLSTTRIANWAN